MHRRHHRLIRGYTRPAQLPPRLLLSWGTIARLAPRGPAQPLVSRRHFSHRCCHSWSRVGVPRTRRSNIGVGGPHGSPLAEREVPSALQPPSHPFQRPLHIKLYLATEAVTSISELLRYGASARDRGLLFEVVALSEPAKAEAVRGYVAQPWTIPAEGAISAGPAGRAGRAGRAGM